MATIAENDQNIQNSQGPQPNGLARIKGLLQRFAVCWEAHPEQGAGPEGPSPSSEGRATKNRLFT